MHNFDISMLQRIKYAFFDCIQCLKVKIVNSLQHWILDIEFVWSNENIHRSIIAKIKVTYILV